METVDTTTTLKNAARYTDLDIESGLFFIRDMRKEGRIVSHIKCVDGEYRFYYDSCSHFGDDDFYYKLFSAITIDPSMDINKLSLEL